MIRWLSMAVSLLLASAVTARAQTEPLPGCDPSPTVARALEVGSQPTPGQARSAWAAARVKKLQDILARNPREYAPVPQMIQLARWDAPDQLLVLRDRFVKEAAVHPSDPLALTFAGMGLYQHDTDAAIRNLQQARKLAPTFPWPALQLAQVYSTGKRMDKAESGRQLAAFFGACPASADSTAQNLLPKVGTPELSRRVATALRSELAKTSDPVRLRRFDTLWSLEFRVRPVSEHSALRDQVAKDLRRLEVAKRTPDAAWLLFLRDASKQAGASKEKQRAYEDRVLNEFPASDEASGVAMSRWRTDHPEPIDHANLEAWQAYYRQRAEFMAELVKAHPADADLRATHLYYRLEDEMLGEAEGVRLVEERLKAEDAAYPGSSGNAWTAANTLLERGWQPARALELAQLALTLGEKEAATRPKNDNLAEDDLRARSDRYEVARTQSLLLRAAIAAGRPEAAGKLAAVVEGPVPEDKGMVSGYWANRARLARLQKRNADALAYYQAALQSRTTTPKPYAGKVRDGLGDEARELWKQMGGTDAAWAKWSSPPAAKGAAVAEEGSWEQAKKVLPGFSLPDLSGKTWTLKGLNGKVLLINLWATWCGPCMNELPHLQKLYEKTKDRSDVQVLTFNVDDELGLVAPFMKEKGYTFPVLPAFDLVMSLLDEGLAIPQNWLVDGTGKWQWTGLGFNPSATDWENETLKKLEGMRTK